MKHTIILVIIALFALQSSADFASDCLNAQNPYRTALNIAPLTWSDDIAKSAQAWADHLASLGKLTHSDSSYGENLASRTGQYTGDAGSSSTDDASSSSDPQTPSPAPTQDANQSSDSSSSSNSDNSNSSGSTSSNSNSNQYQGSGSSGSFRSNRGSQNNGNNYGDNGDDNSYNQSDDGNDSGDNGVDNTYEHINHEDNGSSNNYNQQDNNGEEEEEENNSYNHHGHQQRHRRNQNDNEEEEEEEEEEYGNNYSEDNGDNYTENDGGNGDNYNGRYLAGASATSLVNALTNQWGAEKQYFVYGTFPDVSNGGTVGHYTQMIWAATKQVGCGIANSDEGWVYLVCQYYPAGNMEGDQVY